jgi:hypothetical protein
MLLKQNLTLLALLASPGKIYLNKMLILKNWKLFCRNNYSAAVRCLLRFNPARPFLLLIEENPLLRNK